MKIKRRKNVQIDVCNVFKWNFEIERKKEKFQLELKRQNQNFLFKTCGIVTLICTFKLPVIHLFTYAFNKQLSDLSLILFVLTSHLKNPFTTNNNSVWDLRDFRTSPRSICKDSVRK